MVNNRTIGSSINVGKIINSLFDAEKENRLEITNYYIV